MCGLADSGPQQFSAGKEEKMEESMQRSKKKWKWYGLVNTVVTLDLHKCYTFHHAINVYDKV